MLAEVSKLFDEKTLILETFLTKITKVLLAHLATPLVPRLWSLRKWFIVCAYQQKFAITGRRYVDFGDISNEIPNYATIRDCWVCSKILNQYILPKFCNKFNSNWWKNGEIIKEKRNKEQGTDHISKEIWWNFALVFKKFCSQ